MPDAMAEYLQRINAAYARGDATEHTHRPALKTLIEALGDRVTATNEPRRVDCGAPDFVVSRRLRRTDETFGYIECKDIGTPLGREERSPQLKRYLAGLDNLILTDYIEFRLYVGGEHRQTAVLARERDGTFRPTTDGPDEVAGLFTAFFAGEPMRVSSPKILAERMAGIARLLRDLIAETFAREAEQGPLHTQYEAFKRVLLHDLEPGDFADMYAQTICYGLFAARCHISEQAAWGPDEHAAFHGVDAGPREFTRERAGWLLPKTNPFLRNIFGQIAGPEMDDRVAWLVDDLVALLRNAQMDRVLRDFGHAQQGRTDPVVHFYETFLAAYDPRLRESRGVYYTPEPVVSYIVRSVDWLLREKFGLRRGLADEKKVKVRVNENGSFTPVTGQSLREARQNGRPVIDVHRCLILDPAAGTGTFLFEVIRRIHRRFQRNQGAWPGYVRDHLLPRLFGFELMMAPYAICHMKLGLELADTGYDFESDERLGVYLTNTLEEAEEMTGLPLFGHALAEEVRAANRVKRDLPIMVILGNPPYSGHSENKGDWIRGLLRDYYFVDGEPLGERNPKYLQDDYVKFIRYAQHRIQQTGAGILAFVTNHGYLDNPTFRGMRQQLMQTFSEIYVLDLHGNAKKKETCPDGSKDENVFDIMQGVSIGLFVKLPQDDRSSEVYHAELYGLRGNKYRWLLHHDLQSTNWERPDLNAPFFLFVPRAAAFDDYEGLPSVCDVCPLTSTGVKTHRDHFAVAFTRQDLVRRIAAFVDDSIDDETIRKEYSLPDTRDWKLAHNRRALRADSSWQDNCTLMAYRPFDYRWLYYSDAVVELPRYSVMRHLRSFSNRCLILGRQGLAVSDPQWNLVSVAEVLPDANLFRRGGINVFPFYLYPADQDALGHQRTLDTPSHWPPGQDGRVPNVSPGFVASLAERLGLRFVSDGRGDLGETFGPEDVFDYIYGVLHSPTYRSRYAEFLKIDFPRIPLPRDRALFIGVAERGRRLVALHLMESSTLDEEARHPAFPRTGSNEVVRAHPKYDPGERRVYINPQQYFEPVEREVWDFHVGGYQVCEKWLKDRRGRTLSYDDILHYQKITVALGETIRLMADIDAFIDAHGGWSLG